MTQNPATKTTEKVPNNFTLCIKGMMSSTYSSFLYFQF